VTGGALEAAGAADDDGAAEGEGAAEAEGAAGADGGAAVADADPGGAGGPAWGTGQYCAKASAHTKSAAGAATSKLARSIGGAA
jgi:hypothetical protein